MKFRFVIYLGPKKEKYSTDPNIVGPTQTFLKSFGILKSIFRLFFKDIHTFSIQKSLHKKKVCLPTDAKKFGHVTGNKAYFFLLAWLLA